MITSIGAGKTNMAPCVFVWFLILKQSVMYLLSVKMMMPLQLFFLLWKICASHQLLALWRSFVLAFTSCKILCFPSANDASFLLQRFCGSYELLAWHPLCFHKFFVFHLSMLLLSCLEDLCFSWAACFASFALLQVLNFLFSFCQCCFCLALKICVPSRELLAWHHPSCFLKLQISLLFHLAMLLLSCLEIFLFLTSFLLSIIRAFTIYKVLVFHLPMLLLSLLRTSYVSHRLLVWASFMWSQSL